MILQLPVSQPEILTQPEVLERYRISRSTLWRLREGGYFPKPAIIGGQMIRWRRVDLESWEAAGFPRLDTPDASTLANRAELEQAINGQEQLDTLLEQTESAK